MNGNQNLSHLVCSLRGAGFAFALAATPLAQASTVWTGPNTNYTHSSAAAANPTLAANTDQLTANCWLTRASSLGLFNAKTQTSYGDQGTAGSGTPNGSPSDTEWAIGSIGSFASLSYGSWFSVMHGQNGVGKNGFHKVLPGLS